jgi:hypothetical protein
MLADLVAQQSELFQLAFWVPYYVNAAALLWVLHRPEARAIVAATALDFAIVHELVWTYPNPELLGLGHVIAWTLLVAWLGPATRTLPRGAAWTWYARGIVVLDALMLIPSFAGVVAFFVGV